MRSCLLLFITIFPFFIKGQDRDIDLESFAERFYQLQDDDLPYEQIYESLLQYYMHPVNLNKTSSEELLSLNILTPEQINHLMDHIRKNGPLISIYELQSIPSFSPEIIRDLLPFVTVRERHDSRNLWERIRAEENNYLLLRFKLVLTDSLFNNLTKINERRGNTIYSKECKKQSLSACSNN